MLQKAKAAGFTPGQRDEASRCAEDLELFWSSKQTFGTDGQPFLASPDFQAFQLNGTLISVQPDLLVGSEFPPQDEGKKIGFIMIRPQKLPDPFAVKSPEKQEERKERRREVARYLLVIGAAMLREAGLPQSGFDTKRTAVWDLRLGEAIGFPSNWVSREKHAAAAAGQISRL